MGQNLTQTRPRLLNNLIHHLKQSLIAVGGLGFKVLGFRGLEQVEFEPDKLLETVTGLLEAIVSALSITHVLDKSNMLVQKVLQQWLLLPSIISLQLCRDMFDLWQGKPEVSS